MLTLQKIRLAVRHRQHASRTLSTLATEYFGDRRQVDELYLLIVNELLFREVLKGFTKCGKQAEGSQRADPEPPRGKPFVFLLVAAVIPHRVGTERAATTSDLVKRESNTFRVKGAKVQGLGPPTRKILL